MEQLRRARPGNCTGEKCGAKAENSPARELLRKEMLRRSIDEQSVEMERRMAALRRKRNASFCYEVHGRSRARSRKAKEMEGMLTGFTLNVDQTQNITVTVTGDFREQYEELKKAPVEIAIKKAVKHRSMEANRYCWVLVDQIAAKQHLKKSEVYRNAIRDIGGVSQDMLMKSAAVPVFRQIWEKQGLGNQIEVIDEDEMGWATVRVYYGSSTYDTAQMSALLDSLIQDAEALGIPTITPKEEERMIGKWARKKHEQEHSAG